MKALGHSARCFVGTLCTSVSSQLFMAAKRHGASAQAWHSATVYFLWSALAALCFRWAK
jgi:hypothetical protein